LRDYRALVLSRLQYGARVVKLVWCIDATTWICVHLLSRSLWWSDFRYSTWESEQTFGSRHDSAIAPA